jgi:hypothetical protein
MTETLSPEVLADLKACPFCGELAEVEHDYREDNHRYPRDFWNVRVCCTACDCRQSWSLYGEQEQRKVTAEVKAKAEAQAVALWNTRPEEARLLASLEEAEELAAQNEEQHTHVVQALRRWNDDLDAELRLWRASVTETPGVPRYVVTPGAALNSLVTSTDRLLRRPALSPSKSEADQ